MRRLAAYGAMSFTSTRASEAAQTVNRQLALLDAIDERRLSLEQAARRSTPDNTEIEQATGALDTAVAEARAAIGITGVRTRRTPRRGIRRLGNEYVIITFDETGIEQVNTFDTMREAREFRDAVKVADADKARLEAFSGAWWRPDSGSHPPGPGAGAGGGDGGGG
jgi:hypothetical protein